MVLSPNDIRKTFERQIIDYFNESLLVASYSQNESDNSKPKLDNTHVLAFAKCFSFSSKGYSLLLINLNGYSKRQIIIYNRTIILPPLDKKILITLFHEDVIVEILSTNVRFGHYINNEYIEFENMTFLFKDHESLYPDINEIINIVNFEKQLHIVSLNRYVQRDLKNRTPLKILKIELLESEVEIKEKSKIGTSSWGSPRYSSESEFHPGKYEVYINPFARSATIIWYSYREEWRKDGWDGTREVTYKDKQRTTIFFSTYFQLCEMFSIQYEYTKPYTIQHSFTHPTKFKDVHIETIEGTDYY